MSRLQKLLVFAGLFLILAGIVYVRYAAYPLTINADYFRYIHIAEFFSGSDAPVYGGYILKPLVPIFLFLFVPFTGDYVSAFVLVSVLFYFACAIIFFLFAKAFLKDTPLAILATSLFVLGYPMLKYGLDLYAESGALFFYLAGLYLTYLYIEQPSRRLLYMQLTVVTVGFLWKEYSIVNYVAFNFILLFFPGVPLRERVQNLALYNVPFIALNSLWQIFTYVQFGASYFEWYFGTKTGVAVQWTVFNLMKSVFAILTFSWFLVPLGALALYKEGVSERVRLFIIVTIATSCMAFLWGWVSSRLFYVIAPTCILLAMVGLRYCSGNRYVQIAAVFLVLGFNVVWLHLSY